MRRQCVERCTGIDKEEIAELAENWDGPEVPWVYFCGDHDFFGMIDS